MPQFPISRRALLLASAATFGCSRTKAPRGSGYCYVANQISRTIAVVSLENFRVVRKIALEAAPSAILPHPSNTKALILSQENGTVYEIDAASNTVSRKIHAGNGAVGMQLSPSGDGLWVLYRDPAALIEIRLDSMKTGRQIKLATPHDSFDIVLHRKRSAPLAAIASRKDRSVALASLTKGEIERTFATATEPSLVKFQYDGVQLIAGSWPDRSATFYETASGRMVVRLQLPLAPKQFCTSEDGGQIFITGDGMDAVVVLYPNKTEVAQTLLAGGHPGTMAVSGSYLIVANPEGNGITVLDIQDYKLVAVAEVGRGPRQILVTKDGQYALVLNERSGDLAVVRILALTTMPNGGHRKFKTAPLFTLIPVGDGPIGGALVG